MSKKNPNKKSLWKEFTEFAIKGNAMALAVGTIIGAAFSTITKSLTDDVIMPIVNIFLGGTDFSELKLEIPRIFPVYEEVVDEVTGAVSQGDYIPNYLYYGNLLSAIINFAILAFVVFLIVKGLNKLTEMGKKKEAEAAAEAAPPAPPAPSNEEVLLTEIRDLLAKK